MNQGIRQEVLESIARGEERLLSTQAPDGFWRDYWLKPGPSEDWVTACCGLALAAAPRQSRTAQGLAEAVGALRSAMRPGGWGYNRHTVPDGDSSAWALRCLAALGTWPLRQHAPCLERYLDENGRAHTFLPREQAGSWGDAHADVTPVVGMALASIGASHTLVLRTRNAVIADQLDDGSWHSFWWSTDAYATARSLEFLSLTGGVPARHAERARLWFRSLDEANNSFEAAQRLVISVLLAEPSYEWVDILLEMEAESGQWPPSPVLLAPDKEKPEEHGPAYADDERVLSAAMVIMALKSWLASALAEALPRTA